MWTWGGRGGVCVGGGGSGCGVDVWKKMEYATPSYFIGGGDTLSFKRIPTRAITLTRGH